MAFRSVFSAVVLSAALLRTVFAEPVPTTPGPNESYNEGANCPIAWTADTTGTWKEMAIELMTGSNLQMKHLTTVVTLDGTTATSYNWKCPAVTINADIYFYQFSAQGQNLTWTTRFTIAGADGSSVAPPNATQPDGQQIGWGNGALTDPSTATPPPPWLAASAVGGSSTTPGTASASTSGVSLSPASGAAASTTSHASSAAITSAASTVSAAASNASTTAAANSAALGRTALLSVCARSVTALGVVASAFFLLL